MSADRDLLVQVEAAAVRGWPAPETLAVDGWLCRYASGGSVRANSVATLAFEADTGPERIAPAIGRCENFYAARDAACAFTISDVSVPAGLDALLAARGYRRGDDHVTMAKPVDSDATLPPDVAVGLVPTNGWMEAYLSGLSENRRAVAPRMLERLAGVAVFVSADADGVARSSGLTVVDGALASVQCMATLPPAQRRGSARRVLDGIEAIAAQNACTHLYLQTGADNVAAQALYARHGFRVIGRYHTRTR